MVTRNNRRSNGSRRSAGMGNTNSIQGGQDPATEVDESGESNGGNAEAGRVEETQESVRLYTQRLEDSGRILSEKGAKCAVAQYVRETIFPRMKFLGGRKGLVFDGQLCRAIMSGCGWNERSEEWKRAMWNTVTPEVRKVFKRRKNACHTVIKKNTIGT